MISHKIADGTQAPAEQGGEKLLKVLAAGSTSRPVGVEDVLVVAMGIESFQQPGRLIGQDVDVPVGVQEPVV